MPSHWFETGVIGEARIERLPVAIERAGEEPADALLLISRKAASIARPTAGRHVATQVESGLAGTGILHQTIGRTIEGVALGQYRLRNQNSLGLCEAGARTAWRRGQGVVVLCADDVGRGRQWQPEPWIADQKAIVVVGVARHRDHGVSAAIGAATEVRAIRSLSVGGGDERLGHRRELGDSLVAIVEAGLRVDTEERRRRLVTRVGADHGEAHVQRVVQGAASANRARGGRDTAIHAAVRLVEEASVPGHGQAHLEADGVSLTVDGAGSRIHRTTQLAVRAHGLARDREDASGDRVGRSDGGVGKAEAGERRAVAECRARCRSKFRQGFD